jgi:hypothetical protein
MISQMKLKSPRSAWLMELLASKPPVEQAAVEVTMDAPGWPFDNSL